MDLITKNMAILNQHRDSFARTFNIALTRFMHPLFGFDVINFDSWLHTPDGMSTADYVKQQYGQSALDLVNKLI